MTNWHRPRSKTIWGRPHSNVPALRLESIELRDLLSRELDKANIVLDEWDLARTRYKKSDGKSVIAAKQGHANTGAHRNPLAGLEAHHIRQKPDVVVSSCHQVEPPVAGKAIQTLPRRSSCLAILLAR